MTTENGPDIELSDWDALPKAPVVSVCMITYQHASFIAQALDSVLMQQTNFPFEICLGEDQSTDGTREICQEYAEKHPDKVRLFLRDRTNPARDACSGPGKYNGIETHKACRGKYIALLEGDDCWTDPRKLQKQIDLLEARSEVSICGHYVSTIRLGDRPGASILPKTPEGSVFTMADLLSGHLLGTCSVVFRAASLDIEAYQQVVRDLVMGDVPLFAMLAERGQIGFVSECMGVYRIHGAGAWSPQGRAQKIRNNMKMLEALREHLGPEHHGTIDGILWRTRRELMLATLREGKHSEARLLSRQYLSACRGAHRRAGGRAVGLLLRCYLPFLFRIRRAMRAAWRELRQPRSAVVSRPVASSRVKQPSMLKPKASVVMAVRNGEGHLSRAVDSILAQTFSDFEFIIVDDGSTDGTLALLSDYARQDSRIRVLECSSTCPGQSEPANLGIGVAQGEYICRTDADDASVSTRLERQISALESRPEAGLVAGWAKLVDASGRALSTWSCPESPHLIAWRLCFGNPLAHSSVTFRRSAFEAVGGYDVQSFYCEDFDLWCRLSRDTQLTCLQEEVVSLTRRADSVTFRHRDVQLARHDVAGARHLSAMLGRRVSEAVVRLLHRGECSDPTVVREAASVILALWRSFGRTDGLSQRDRRLIRRDAGNRLWKLTCLEGGSPMSPWRVMPHVFVLNPGILLNRVLCGLRPLFVLKNRVLRRTSGDPATAEDRMERDGEG